MTTNITIITVTSLLCFTFLVAYFGYLIMKTEIYKVRRLLRIIARQRQELVEIRKTEQDIIDEWLKDMDKRNSQYDELLDKIYQYESAKQNNNEL